MKRIVRASNKFDWGKMAGILVLYAATAIALPAQTFTTLYSFCGGCRDGWNPDAGLVQGIDGDLYGTTSFGGSNCTGLGDNCGTVFKITPSGRLATLYSFCSQTDCTDGAAPQAVLVQATNGDFYGTTSNGGANCISLSGCGTVFKITPDGTFTTLYSFCAKGTYPNCTDGWYPAAGLVQATNGDLYGTTLYGGSNGPCPTPESSTTGCGTVFRITPGGTLTTLYTFCSQSDCTDGYQPFAGLVQATNGNLYGTTQYGGETDGTCNPHYGCGTVFKITLTGTLTTLYSFGFDAQITDGLFPGAGLVQAVDGDFYGTTSQGGPNGAGGTVFRITSTGTLTTLYGFCAQSGCADGDIPHAALIQGTDGDFYGTTAEGGSACNRGTIFKIAPSGMLTTLYDFCPNSGGDTRGVEAGLVQATNGNLYGTTWNGGTDGDGAVFSLSVGLGPFVKTLPHSGGVGAAVTIFGTNLTGATSVSFNGTPAAFDVVSVTAITTTVPAGATTGSVQVTTPGGSLLSGPFLVVP
jgi:uncharacterized repeat protein (TIGR03803 family)